MCDMPGDRPRCRQPARCAYLSRIGRVRMQGTCCKGEAENAPATVRRENSDGRWQRWQRPTFLVTTSACGTRERICPKASRRKSPSSPATITALWCLSAAATQNSFKSGKNCACTGSDERAAQSKKEASRTSSTAMTSTASNSAVVRRSCNEASRGSARHCCGHERAATSAGHSRHDAALAHPPQAVVADHLPRRVAPVTVGLDHHHVLAVSLRRAPV